MTFLMENARAKKIWFDEDNMWILFIDGRQLSIPKSFFPKFSHVSEDELNNFELSGNGIGIHWDSLDEDLYVPNLLIEFPSQNHKKFA